MESRLLCLDSGSVRKLLFSKLSATCSQYQLVLESRSQPLSLSAFLFSPPSTSSSSACLPQSPVISSFRPSLLSSQPPWGCSAPAPPAHAALPLASPCSSPATHGWGSGGGKGRGQLGLMSEGTYVSVQICVEQHQGTGQGVGSVCSTSTGQGLEPLGADRARGSCEPAPPSPGTWGTRHQHGAGSTQASR